MKKHKWQVLAGALAALSLILAGCSSGAEAGARSEATTSDAAQIDINPQDPTTLRDGGELQIAADQMPDNWNYYQLDGPTGDGFRILSTVMPTIWAQNPDGTVHNNTDYVESAELTSSQPQVVTYQLNPKAKWSTGEPLSWRDFAAQAAALSGTKADYTIGTSAGYEDIAAVERGATDQEVRVTFKRSFAEWQTIFSPLYPASIFGTAGEFNTGWLHAPKVTAGPFKIGTIDLSEQTVTVVRDPHWWGTTPRLDAITFRVIRNADLVQAMATGKIDFYFIGSKVDLLNGARQTSGVVVREAMATDYSTLVFNGAANAILADQGVRVAMQKGIDTKAISTAVLGQFLSDPKPLGNHLFLHGNPAYKDNSGIVSFDPPAARKRLDELGWKLVGDVRVKGGKELSVRFVIGAGNPVSDKVSQMVRDQLKNIGVQVNIEPTPAADYFKSYVNVGNFDLSTFRWLVTAFPVTNSRGVYYLDPANVNENYGKVGNAGINSLFDQALAELDPGQRLRIADQIDQEIWKTGSQLPLFQTSGAVAVRDTVANFGAAGYAAVPYNWIRVGFTR